MKTLNPKRCHFGFSDHAGKVYPVHADRTAKVQRFRRAISTVKSTVQICALLFVRVNIIHTAEIGFEINRTARYKRALHSQTPDHEIIP
jgi:hypothetical protein